MSEVSTRNITRVFRTATADQLANGLAWYLDANTIANALANENNVSVEKCAGIISALSPMMSWGANVNIATRFITAGGLERGALKTNLAKSRAILAGADILTTLNGLKVQNFYDCILTNGLGAGVCIDRHAYDIATNTRHTDATRPKLSPKRYNECADAYRRAASILSRELGYPVSGAQVQAVTWVAWRSRYWSAGAFDVP
jgi:hypothetical protein